MNIITRVFDYLGSGVWSTEEIEVGGGGSQPTDAPIVFTEEPGDGETYPIVGVDQGAATIDIDGDHAARFQFGAATIAGSTGLDGVYDIVYSPIGSPAATYNSGTGKTTIFLDAELADDTADGTIRAPVVYSSTVVLGENSALEWIYADTTEAWEVGDSSVWIRITDSDGNVIDNHTEIFAVKFWQWPLITLHGGGGGATGALSTGDAFQYLLYPNGTTITILISSRAGGTTGVTEVVVHHHDVDPVVTPTRTPAA